MLNAFVEWRDNMKEWLELYAISKEGYVWSWVNDAKPGFHYPEIAGYMLSLFADAGYRPDLARLVAHRLYRDLALNGGGVGRDGVVYLFDTAMALAGILAHLCREPQRQFTSSVAQSLALVKDLLRQRRCSLPKTNMPLPHRWSTVYGPHILKVSYALVRAHRHLSDTEALTLIQQLISDIMPLYRNGRFLAFPELEDCNLHANCYALEGLLICRESGSIADAAANCYLLEGTDWLTEVQEANGAIPEWHNGRRAWGAYRADVTAQAVRLWLVIDRKRYAREIERGLMFLSSLRTSEGGLRFDPLSLDVNTWATIFAIQALDLLMDSNQVQLV
jgi:hypothetical protein